MDTIRGTSFKFNVLVVDVNNLDIGKKVYLKWRRSLAQSGETEAASVDGNGVAQFKAPIDMNVTMRKSFFGGGQATMSTGEWMSKTVTWKLKEQLHTHPGTVIARNPTLAKGTLELSHFTHASNKAVAIELRPVVDDVGKVGMNPILNLQITANVRPLVESHEM